MGYSQGALVEIAIGKEASYDATYSAPTKGLRIEPTVPMIAPEFMETNHATGQLYAKDLETTNKGVWDWELPLTFRVPKGMPAFQYILESMFEWTSDTGAVSTTDPASLVIYYTSGVDTWGLPGGKVRDMSLEFSADNQYVLCNCTLIGTHPQRGAAAPGGGIDYSDELTTAQYYTFKDSTTTIGGGAYAIHNITWNFDCGLYDSNADTREIGSRYRKRLVNGQREITYNIDAVFNADDMSEFDDIDADTAKAIITTASADSRELTITATNSRWRNWQPSNEAGLHHKSIDGIVLWNDDAETDFTLKYDLTGA